MLWVAVTTVTIAVSNNTIVVIADSIQINIEHEPTIYCEPTTYCTNTVIYILIK